MIQVQLKRSKKLQLEPKLRAALERMDGSYVTVGIHSDAGSYPAKNGRDGPTVAEVANWLEYGTDQMPARSFMRSTLAESKEILTRLMDRAIVAVGFRKWTVERGLSLVGAGWLRAVQNKVKSNVAPPLGHSPGSQAYLARKLSQGMPARTLIATHKLLTSLAYKVFLSAGAEAEAQSASSEGAAQESGSRTGRAESRSANRAAAKEQKARAKQARSTFANDKGRQERFARQQATKHKA